MTIKDGYGSEKLEIWFDTSAGDKYTTGLWIEQRCKHEPTEHDETLAYATLGELVELRDELNNVIRRVIGL